MMPSSVIAETLPSMKFGPAITLRISLACFWRSNLQVARAKEIMLVRMGDQVPGVTHHALVVAFFELRDHPLEVCSEARVANVSCACVAFCPSGEALGPP